MFSRGTYASVSKLRSSEAGSSVAWRDILFSLMIYKRHKREQLIQGRLVNEQKLEGSEVIQNRAGSQAFKLGFFPHVFLTQTGTNAPGSGSLKLSNR